VVAVAIPVYVRHTEGRFEVRVWKSCLFILFEGVRPRIKIAYLSKRVILQNYSGLFELLLDCVVCWDNFERVGSALIYLVAADEINGNSLVLVVLDHQSRVALVILDPAGQLLILITRTERK